VLKLIIPNGLYLKDNYGVRFAVHTIKKSNFSFKL